MKILKRPLIAIGLLIAVLVAIAFALPNQFNVARSVTINAPAEKIYPLVATTGQWKNWSVWNRRDPNMKIDYAGPQSGLGAKWSWESKSEGSGEMEFTAAEPNKLLGYRLLFKDFNTTCQRHIETRAGRRRHKSHLEFRGRGRPQPDDALHGFDDGRHGRPGFRSGVGESQGACGAFITPCREIIARGRRLLGLPSIHAALQLYRASRQAE